MIFQLCKPLWNDCYKVFFTPSNTKLTQSFTMLIKDYISTPWTSVEFSVNLCGMIGIKFFCYTKLHQVTPSWHRVSRCWLKMIFLLR